MIHLKLLLIINITFLIFPCQCHRCRTIAVPWCTLGNNLHSFVIIAGKYSRGRSRPHSATPAAPAPHNHFSLLVIKSAVLPAVLCCCCSVSVYRHNSGKTQNNEKGKSWQRSNKPDSNWSRSTREVTSAKSTIRGL